MQRDVHKQIFENGLQKSYKGIFILYIDSWNNTVINGIYAYYFLWYTLLGVLMDIDRKYTRNFSCYNHVRWWIKTVSQSIK